MLNWNPTAADQGLTSSDLPNTATGVVNTTLGTWSPATWSRANGGLRAGFANSSYTCKTCSAAADGSVNSSLGTWTLGTWTTVALN